MGTQGDEKGDGKSDEKSDEKGDGKSDELIAQCERQQVPENWFSPIVSVIVNLKSKNFDFKLTITKLSENQALVVWNLGFSSQASLS